MHKTRAILSEALLVGVMGLVFAIAANALSPHGLRLNRNYFPDAGSPPPGAPSFANSPFAPATAGDAIQRIRHRGMQPLNSEEVAELFRTPDYEQGLLVFMDARDNPHYTAGHIPGAWQLYHYRAEDYLPAIVPVCMAALQVVVYCNGGNCEDSEFAAMMLSDAGVPRENLFIYAGGITEWTASGLPIETGSRRSGEFLQPER
jgi:rhodanese-related sulfurtransferase